MNHLQRWYQQIFLYYLFYDAVFLSQRWDLKVHHYIEDDFSLMVFQVKVVNRG
jgi:hypothetical protein